MRIVTMLTEARGRSWWYAVRVDGTVVWERLVKPMAKRGTTPFVLAAREQQRVAEGYAAGVLPASG